MDSEDLLQTLESARLELEYERSLQVAERLHDEERARTLRVQLLLLEYENDEAREKIDQDQEDLQQSEDVVQDLQDRFADLEEQYQTAQAELKACMRDIDQYQAEINALNAANTDATKVLTAKLALSRELSTLKPELEHLRSQVATQENVLADKLSLQRELNTAQIELENERKTIQRLKQRSNSNDTALADEMESLKKELAEEKKANQKLTKQNTKRANEKSTADAALVDELETLREDLTKAREKLEQAEERAREGVASAADRNEIVDLKKELTRLQTANQKFEREQLKNSREWSSQKESLESKLDAFRTKLRTTKEQLKQAQEELDRQEASKFAESAKQTEARLQGHQHRESSVQPQSNIALSANPRKRNVARFDPDMTIGTPGHGGPAGAKRARLTISNVGDKSTFSITPYLNRTQSVLADSPGGDGHEKVDQALNETINELAEEADKEAEAHASKTSAGKGGNATEKKKTVPSSKKASLGSNLESSSAVTAQRAKSTSNVRSSKSTKQPALAKVDEEISDSENRAPGATTKISEPSQSEVTASQQMPNATKKKKLLGGPRNIFDDEEADGIRKKTILGGPKMAKLGLGGFGKSKSKMLAEFSPLKKDRRGTAGMTTIIEA